MQKTSDPCRAQVLYKLTEVFLSATARHISVRSNSNGPIRVKNETTLRAAIVARLITSLWGKPKRCILRQIFRFSAAKERIFGVKFIGLNGTVIFIAIRDFSCWGESDLWSDVWPAMYGVVCLSILLEGGVTVSNNFTKRRQNGFKIGTKDKFATHFR